MPAQAATVQTPPRVQREPGLMGKLLSLLSHLFAILVTSLALSVVIEWIGIACFWPDMGWHHSQTMFSTEFGYISETFKQSLVFREPGKTVSEFLTWAYQTLFVDSGFIGFTQSANVGAGDGTAIGTIKELYLYFQNYALSMVYITLTFLTRLMILTLSIPLFLMTMLVGGTDGLMRRDLRRFGAGRESSFVYHRARRLIVPLLLAPWFIYLTLPFSVQPLIVLIPCAIALGIAVEVTAATFKKYL
jgi:integrating conjugative element membrane protein (TIGR03747 family)